MILLNDYAQYLKQNELDNLVAIYINNILAHKVPIDKINAPNHEPDIHQQCKSEIENLLAAFSTGKALDIVKTRLQEWKQMKILEIEDNTVEFTDLLNLFTSQKLSLVKLIPNYTQDVLTSVNLMEALVVYYKEVNELAFNIIREIELNERKIRIETEEKYHDLFDNASDLVHLCAPDGSILYVNKSWSETLGYKKEELIGKSIYNYINPAENESFIQYRQSVLKGTEDKVGRNTIFISKNGNQIITEGFVSCKFQNGKPEYTRAILKNVTEKKKQEERLKFYNQQLVEREENLSQLIKNAPDAIIVMSQDHEIILWNTKAEYIFGWSSEEVVGKYLPDIIIPPELRILHVQGMERYLKTGETRVLNKTVEVMGLKKSGEPLFISLTISKSTREGKLIFTSFLRDTTVQKNNALELERKRIQLEHTINELEQYAWLTSHDLKEPLRKIIIFSDSVLHKFKLQLPEKVNSYLEKINRSAHRMNRLIEAILLYSNVSDDKTLYKSTDLNAVTDEVLEDIEMLIKTNQAQINIGRLPVLKAIPVQMHQLFQNLLINAIKYQQPGTQPVINIASIIVDDHYQISIEDNGLGFDDKYATKIFEVFQRLSHDNKYEGTGIGLALCKKIVETHNGRIYATSIINQGSKFFIELPLH